MNNKDKKRKPAGFFIAQVIYLLAGGACGVALGPYLASRLFYYGPAGMLLFLLILVFAVYFMLFIHVAVHEAGHLFFGLKSGYKFVSYRLGSFIWVKTPDGIKFRRYSIAGTGGQCLLSPPDMDENGMFPVMLYNFGGSIFNAALSLIMLLFYTFLPGGTLMSAALAAGAILGLASALANGIPLRLGDINNDGYNALNLRHDGDSMLAFWLQLKINALSAQGLRLSQMPEDYFFLPSPEQMDSALTASYAAFVFSRELDRLDLDRARSYGEYILQNASGLIDANRKAIESELLYIEIVTDNRTDVISRYMTDKLEKSLSASKITPSCMRIMYAYEKSRGFGDKAAKYKKAFEKTLSSYPNAGEIETEKALFSLSEK